MIMSGGAIQRYFSGLSRDTFFLAFASVFSDISTEMLYPVLPIFLTQSLHASGSIVGLVDGFAQALQNIVQGFSGTLSDRLQKRKPIALAGFLLSAISKPLMGLATVWPALFAARLLDRLGAGTRSAPRDALIASSVAEENRGRAFGLEGAGDYLLPGDHSRPVGVRDGAIRPRTSGRDPGRSEDRHQPAAISPRLLEVSAGDRCLRIRQLE
jgi:hypothetical protein